MFSPAFSISATRVLANAGSMVVPLFRWDRRASLRKLRASRGQLLILSSDVSGIFRCFSAYPMSPFSVFPWLIDLHNFLKAAEIHFAGKLVAPCYLSAFFDSKAVVTFFEEASDQRDEFETLTVRCSWSEAGFGR